MKILILILIVGAYVYLTSKKVRSAVKSFLKRLSLKSLHGRIECSCDRHIWEQVKKAPGVLSHTDRSSRKKEEEKAVCIIEKCTREGCKARRGLVDTGRVKQPYSADFLEETIFAPIEKMKEDAKKETEESSEQKG